MEPKFDLSRKRQNVHGLVEGQPAFYWEEDIKEFIRLLKEESERLSDQDYSFLSPIHKLFLKKLNKLERRKMEKQSSDINIYCRFCVMLKKNYFKSKLREAINLGKPKDMSIKDWKDYVKWAKSQIRNINLELKPRLNQGKMSSDFYKRKIKLYNHLVKLRKFKEKNGK